jgi:hypothetical protein
MTASAKGTFDVKIIPQPADDPPAGPFGRYRLDKHYHGDLDGRSQGQMLGAGTAVEESGAYVALEEITGSLGGRRGTFMLQHHGTKKRGSATMTVTVVPDSGTGDLVGLSGTLTILIEGGQHSYEFAYALPDA